jgi:hypothetical protein
MNEPKFYMINKWFSEVRNIHPKHYSTISQLYAKVFDKHSSGVCPSLFLEVNAKISIKKLKIPVPFFWQLHLQKGCFSMYSPWIYLKYSKLQSQKHSNFDLASLWVYLDQNNTGHVIFERLLKKREISS